MTTAVAIKLVAVLLTAALGYGAGRFRLLTHGASGSDAARVLSNAALYVFDAAQLVAVLAVEYLSAGREADAPGSEVGVDPRRLDDELAAFVPPHRVAHRTRG